MRLIITSLLAVLTLATHAQKMYVATYSQSVKARLSGATMKSGQDADSSEKEIKKMIFEFVLKDQEVEIQFLDSVIVYKDSALVISILIKTDENDNGFRISTNAEKSHKVWKGGRFYNIQKNGSKRMQPEDSYFEVFPTENKLVILGYPTIEYRSKDEKTKVWIAKSLPSSINPGIGIQKVKGAVLKYEFKNELNNNVTIIQTLVRK